MKSFFVFSSALGLIALIGLGIYLSTGISVNSKEVVKEIQLKRNA